MKDSDYLIPRFSVKLRKSNSILLYDYLKNRHIDPWKRISSPEIDLYICGGFFDKGVETIQEEKLIFSINSTEHLKTKPKIKGHWLLP